MKKLIGYEKILVLASALLLLSIVLMIAVLPPVLHDKTTQANPQGAFTGILVSLSLHLMIFAGYVNVIRSAMYKNTYKRGYILVLGILLFFIGVLYADGAIAFLSHKAILYVSVLMFMSVFCDVIASMLTIIAFYKKTRIEK